MIDRLRKVAIELRAMASRANQVSYRGKNVHIGRFGSALEAAAAYDAEASRLHGSFLTTNASLGTLGSTT